MRVKEIKIKHQGKVTDFGESWIFKLMDECVQFYKPACIVLNSFDPGKNIPYISKIEVIFADPIFNDSFIWIDRKHWLKSGHFLNANKQTCLITFHNGLIGYNLPHAIVLVISKLIQRKPDNSIGIRWLCCRRSLLGVQKTNFILCYHKFLLVLFEPTFVLFVYYLDDEAIEIVVHWDIESLPDLQEVHFTTAPTFLAQLAFFLAIVLMTHLFLQLGDHFWE